jgi:hypothetical protein
MINELGMADQRMLKKKENKPNKDIKSCLKCCNACRPKAL